MARIRLTIEVPDVAAAELRQAVSDLDALDSNDEGISPKYVSSYDVVGILYSGDYNPHFTIIEDEITD